MPTKYSKGDYGKYHASKAAKKDRASRTTARRRAIKAGKVSKGDGKEIDHKNHNARDNKASNLRVVDRSTNRKRPRKKNGHTKRRK